MQLKRAGTGKLKTAAAAALCVLGCCFNPFFPPTGTPDPTPPLRSRPEGVIRQLIQAYEMKRIDLFTDLFPASRSFQFYVSPSFVTTYGSRGYVNPPEPRDTLLHYIVESPYYYYWTQELEIQSHRNLFSKAESIEFTVRPSVNPGDFRYLADEKGDTTNVEVLMTNGQITIKVNAGTFTEEYTIMIDRQVFFLERDPAGLWVIRKWYDFGSSP
jgi:hypothetical protein